jgi:hypothetical protein
LRRFGALQWGPFKPKLFGDVDHPVFATEKSALAARLIAGHPSQSLVNEISAEGMRKAS